MPDTAVVVAPDLGAVKLARDYGRRLGLPMALVHKTRRDGEGVRAHRVVGEVRGRPALVVDDMLSTGGTVKAAVEALRSAGAVDPLVVAVTHPLLVGTARETVQSLGITRRVAGNTVAIEPSDHPRLEIASVAPLIATAIRRDHQDESLADLRARL